jgi:hypothetical protein
MRILAFFTGFIFAVPTIELLCSEKESYQMAGLFCFFLAVMLFEFSFRKEKNKP